MTIEFPPKTASKLNRLKEWLEATSYVAVVIDALKWLHTTLEEREKGARVIFVYPDGRQVEQDTPRA